LYDGETNTIEMIVNNSLGLENEYIAHELCDLIHLEGARSLASYKNDFYAGRPALTVNTFGKGKAYYIASRNKGQFHFDFYSKIVKETGVRKVVESELPSGVTAQYRTDGESDYVFILNFTEEVKKIDLSNVEYTNLLEGTSVSSQVELSPLGVKLLKRKAK